MVPGAGPASGKGQVHRQTGGKLYTVKFMPSQSGLILGSGCCAQGWPASRRSLEDKENWLKALG